MAVSAPDNGKVFLVQPGTAPPFAPTDLMELTAAAGFGRSLAVADFDGDGASDLAVGSPQLDEVSVYFGCGTGTAPACSGGGTGPIDPTTAVVVPAELTGDDLAWSMVAGAVRVDGGVALLAGAPGRDVGADSNSGAVCTIEFAARSPTLTCYENPIPFSGGWSFGSEVALANVSTFDNMAQNDTPEAVAPEIIVGAPGANDPVDLDPTLATSPYTTTPSSGGTGAVYVFRASDSGPVIERSSPSLDNHMLAQVFSPGNSTFGGSLTVGDLQTGAPTDLVIGYGGPTGTSTPQVIVTRNIKQYGFDDPRIGLYNASTTVGSADWTVFMTEEGRVGFWNEDPVTIVLLNKDGDPCVLEDEDGEVWLNGILEFDGDSVFLPTVDMARDEKGVTQCLEHPDGETFDLEYSHWDPGIDTSVVEHRFRIEPVLATGFKAACEDIEDPVEFFKIGEPICD